MNKIFVFLLVAISLFASLAFSSKTSAGKTQSAFIPSRVTPTPLAKIERIDLDKKEAVIPCGCFKDNFSPCSLDTNGEIKKGQFLIAVKTFVRNPKNTKFFYEYAVTGGRILGQGGEVLWDLDGFRPGVYTITVSIRGARGISTETRTETVTVRECNCNCPCMCPTITVKGDKNIRASESVDFSAEVLGGTGVDITYNWTVSQGEIVSGQGTSQIKVKTTQKMTGEIKVSLEIGGSGLCPECPRTASETVGIIK